MLLLVRFTALGTRAVLHTGPRSPCVYYAIMEVWARAFLILDCNLSCSCVNHVSSCVHAARSSADTASCQMCVAS